MGLESLVGAVGGGALGTVGGFLAARSERRRGRAIQGAIEESELESRELARQAVTSREFRNVSSFLNRLFSDPLSNPLIQNFRSGLRQAQADRGLFLSPAAAAAEARRTSGLAAQLQLQAVAPTLGLVGFEERFRQSIFPLLAETEVRFATGGQGGFSDRFGQTDPLVGAIAGGLAGSSTGAAAGQAIGGGGGGGGLLGGLL